MDKTTILIVDDEIDVRMSLSDLLENEGYETIMAESGKEALSIIQERIPHLILLDLMLPDINGYQICEKIRQDIVFCYIPVIMFTGMDIMDSELKALDFGADDYVIKSIQPARLLAKIKSLISRTYLGLDANPLTMLPGNNSIREKIDKHLEKKDIFALCYIDIDNFKIYNDIYGFEQGDKVIRLTASVIIEAMRMHSGRNDFLGHIGGDDFVLITSIESVEVICMEILKRFDDSIPEMYSKEDREKGCVFSADRQGIMKKFPLMTISIGVVTNELKTILHSAQISQIASEMKQYAKSFSGSNYFVNKRGIRPHSKG
ncbi:MAG: response regulator [Candidatus Desantisbacteria bacterium]